MKCKSFKPQVSEKSKVLILGSMPGKKSLEMQQYYAYPANRFWKIMGVLCCKENFHQYSYEDRINTLLDNGYALFDVIKSCKREGSLDSNIKDVMPNNIPALLKKYPKIKTICTNGTAAFEALYKYFPDINDKAAVIKMPSTSPANAAYRMEDLLTFWLEIKV